MPHYLWIVAPKGDRYYLVVSYQSWWTQWLGGIRLFRYVPKTFTIPGGFFFFFFPQLQEA